MGNLKEINAGLEGHRDAALDALFADMPTEVSVIADVPSKGMFYTGFQGIKVNPLLFEDERKILLSKGGNINIINSILERCVEGVKISDLLLADKMTLLMKVKEISYGETYSFDTVCPKCSGNVRSEINVASGLSTVYFPKELTDPREILLPLLKAKVSVRFPRVSDEIYLQTAEDNVNNMYRFVISINGQEDPVFIAKALKKMHIRDLKTIANAINRNDLGLDNRFQFECPHCGFNSIMEIPLTSTFFSVS